MLIQNQYVCKIIMEIVLYSASEINKYDLLKE